MRPVLLIAQTGLLGGAERVLLDWGRALEHPVLLACPPGPLVDAAAGAGFAVLALPERPLQRRGRSGRALLELAGLARDVARLARRHRPAVLVASGRRPILAAAAVPLAGAKLVALHHDLAPGGSIALALRAGSARADAIVGISRAVGRDAGRRTEVVHPGVELDRWKVSEPASGTPRALFLGALAPVKRPDLALEIAARVPGLALDLAGAPLPGDPPAFVAALHARANRPDLKGRVRFLGAVEDPLPALTESRCLLHCAEREAFGLALVEALAAGRPVAAPAAGGPLEIITPACGRLYVPGDSRSGAAALQELLAGACTPAAARARAEAFDGAAAARRFADVVERVIAS